MDKLSSCHNDKLLMIAGWEFAMDTNVGNYSPIERNYHLSRRRKWIRTRERISDVTLIVSLDSHNSL